jgi:hypothetical protein
MTEDEYRRHAIEARTQAARTTNPTLKASFEQLAREWMALAERTEWLNRRYGSAVMADMLQNRSQPVAQQQQQIQPKDNGDD